MTSKTIMLALLAASALTAPAFAQTAPTQAPGDVPSDSPSQPGADQPSADTPPPLPTPEEAATNMAFLQAQVEALQSQLEALKKQVTTIQPSWKGAPQFSGDNGFSFKPKGFLQFDAGYLKRTAGARSFQALGTATRARRLVFGGEGTLPGGFGYNVEFNLAQGVVDYEDIILTYQAKRIPVLFKIGNQYPLASLDTMTSSRLGSFIERATFTEAFAENRRLGVTANWVDPADRFTIGIGGFSQEINDRNGTTGEAQNGDVRTGWQLAGRATFSPQFGKARLHFGVNAQHREFRKDAQQLQYRARPFTQITSQRFIDTGNVAGSGDDILGAEFAGTYGPIHWAAEAQKLWVRSYQPGHIFGRNNGTAGTLYLDDPDFFSAYGEVGYYLTGETRAYKGGRWDRTKVLHPFDQGGIGAIQINGRVDYTNLNSRVGPGPNLAANNYFVNGGKQVGYEASLIWTPIDYIRFLTQFAHTDITGGPQNYTGTPAIRPFGLQRIDARKYHNDELVLRAQVEF